MKDSVSERRMAENEVVFRKYNERVQQGFDAVKKVAKEAGQEHFVVEVDAPLYFYCECSDENCHERIRLTTERYKINL
jgi:hypothetical protein